MPVSGEIHSAGAERYWLLGSHVDGASYFTGSTLSSQVVKGTVTSLVKKNTVPACSPGIQNMSRSDRDGCFLVRLQAGVFPTRPWQGSIPQGVFLERGEPSLSVLGSLKFGLVYFRVTSI